jgi:hypothetical protein
MQECTRWRALVERAQPVMAGGLAARQSRAASSLGLADVPRVPL